MATNFLKLIIVENVLLWAKNKALRKGQSRHPPCNQAYQPDDQTMYGEE